MVKSITFRINRINEEILIAEEFINNNFCGGAEYMDCVIKTILY